MTDPKKILVVGAGFAGAVMARELAEQGFWVDVIESREHIAGNCYDPIDERYNLRVHHYGPHIFHTNSEAIYTYLSRFTQWLPYQHKVEALVEGIGYVPFPINRITLNRLYDKKLKNRTDVEAFLDRLKEHHKKPDNARHMAENIYGKELVELFFSRYTKKMWALELEELPCSVFARLAVRYDDQSGYFDDTYQAMPAQGYVTLFERLFDHPQITVHLSEHFDRAMENDYDHVFNSMAIDDYYQNEFGALAYRSIKYQIHTQSNHKQPVPTVNLTDTQPVTRFTDWSLYPAQQKKTALDTLVTKEIPCSYTDNNNERYYPVKTVDGEPQRRYKQYKDLAKMNKKCTFIGRCGQYRYLDMHQVVANSLLLAHNFIQLK